MNKELTPNPKCSNCRCYWKPDETDIKSSGLQYKTCRSCRERAEETRKFILDYKNEKVVCFCGATYTRKYFLHHMRNKKHHYIEGP